MQIRYHAETKQFDRDNNEDFFFADEKNGLYIVADGMGGAAGGEVASKFVPLLAGRIIKNLGAVVARGDEDSILYDEKVFCYDHQNALRHAYLETHDQLRVMGLKNVDLMNMGCAIVMLFFRNERVYIMNGGDCRCYLLGDRKLRQITRDHSFMEHLIRSGELTEEEARRHPKRGRLTRWVGGDKFIGMADTYVMPYYGGDRFILCTDGVHKILLDDQIEEYGKEKDIKEGAEKVIQAIDILSEKRRDNATVMIVEVSGPAKAAFDKTSLEKTGRYRLTGEEEEETVG